MSDNNVSSSGDGITALGFKSSPQGKACCICVIYVFDYVLLSLLLAFSSVMFSIDDSVMWVVLIAIDGLLFVFLITLHVIFMCRLRETEVHINSQTKKLVIKSKHTKLCNCFGDNERKEFSIDNVHSIEQASMGTCDNGRQVGLLIRLTSGESYAPPRPNFNIDDITRLQEFLQRYKLGIIGTLNGRSSFFLPNQYTNQSNPCYSNAPTAPLSTHAYIHPGTYSQSFPGYYFPPQTPGNIINMGNMGSTGIGTADGYFAAPSSSNPQQSILPPAVLYPDPAMAFSTSSSASSWQNPYLYSYAYPYPNSQNGPIVNLPQNQSMNMVQLQPLQQQKPQLQLQQQQQQQVNLGEGQGQGQRYGRGGACETGVGAEAGAGVGNQHVSLLANGEDF